MFDILLILYPDLTVRNVDDFQFFDCAAIACFIGFLATPNLGMLLGGTISIIIAKNRFLETYLIILFIIFV
jgi:hypothetical protein